MNGIESIAAERRRQIEKERWSSRHDDEHAAAEMAMAAACYALSGAGWARDAVSEIWPKTWGRNWWKPKNCRADLVRAGALIAAEIDRLDRAAATAGIELARESEE